MALMQVDKLTMRFGGITAVDNLSFEVEKNSITALIGPNGSGKTSAFNCLTGFYKATSGSIVYNNESLIGLQPYQITYKKIIRTFQNVRLFRNMTVLENVKIGFHINTSAGIMDALLHTRRYKEEEERVTASGLGILEKVGLSLHKDTRAGNMPYGLQRRVEIARALALNPKVLLLDEPAAGMNPRETMELMEFIRTLNSQGYTIVVIEHDMKFVMNACSHVLVLNFGMKICEGTPGEVRENRQVQEAYFGKGIVTGDAVHA
jgi:branched-chain amino acid transport system ATP-binding protein